MSPERRTDLRNKLGISLDRWLASVAAQSGATRLLVADTDGLLVAGPMDSEAAELAVEASASSKTEGPRSLEVRALRVWNEELLVCATGEPSHRAEALRLAEPGLIRIFAGSEPV